MRGKSFIVGLLVLHGAPAAAALEYTAHPACPSAQELVDHVKSREPDAARALEALAVTVTATRAGGQYVAAVRIGDGGAREVAAPNCGQAVEAIALVLALALREHAPPPPPPPPSPPPPATLPPPPPVPVVRAPPPAVVTWAAGVGVGVVGGVVPGVRPSVPFFLEARRVGPDRFAPSARLGLVWAVGSASPEPGVSADFSWFAVELEPCAGWRVGEAWLFDGCLRARLGGLQGRGQDVQDPTRPWRGWVSLGAAARARFELDAWFLELDVGASAPLLRDRFFYGPDLTLHRPSAVAGLARLQGGWSFW